MGVCTPTAAWSAWDSGGQGRASLVSPRPREGRRAGRVKLDVLTVATVRGGYASPPVGASAALRGSGPRGSDPGRAPGGK